MRKTLCAILLMICTVACMLLPATAADHIYGNFVEPGEVCTDHAFTRLRGTASTGTEHIMLCSHSNCGAISFVPCSTDQRCAAYPDAEYLPCDVCESGRVILHRYVFDTVGRTDTHGYFCTGCGKLRGELCSGELGEVRIWREIRFIDHHELTRQCASCGQHISSGFIRPAEHDMPERNCKYCKMGSHQEHIPFDLNG